MRRATFFIYSFFKTRLVTQVLCISVLLIWEEVNIFNSVSMSTFNSALRKIEVERQAQVDGVQLETTSHRE